MPLVEILVTSNCPHERAAITRVAVAAQILELRTDIRVIEISDLEGARRHAFFGSPTIRVDGHDIASARGTEAPSLRCRLYETTHGLDWVPDVRPVYLALIQAGEQSLAG
jgi:hypothetical protein